MKDLINNIYKRLYSFLLVLLIFLFSGCYTPAEINNIRSDKIDRIKIDAVHFYTSRPIRVEKSQLGKRQDVSATIFFTPLFDSCSYYLRKLALDTVHVEQIKDYKAHVIFYTSNKKRLNIYISSLGYIVIGKSVYKKNPEFIGYIYSLLPPAFSVRRN